MFEYKKCTFSTGWGWGLHTINNPSIVPQTFTLILFLGYTIHNYPSKVSHLIFPDISIAFFINFQSIKRTFSQVEFDTSVSSNSPQSHTCFNTLVILLKYLKPSQSNIILKIKKIPVFRCSGVPAFRCSGVPGFRSGIYRHPR